MNNPNQKRKRSLLAACLALLLTLPIASLAVAGPSVPAAHEQGRFEDFYRPARAEAKPDADSAGTACAGKAMLRPGERISGSRGTDSHTYPKTLTTNGIGFQLTSCSFVSVNNKHFTLSAVSRAAHSCRAPPIFFS